MIEIIIKRFKIARIDGGGCQLRIPKLWMDDVKLQVGDYIRVYRDEEDRLILKAEKKNYVEWYNNKEKKK